MKKCPYCAEEIQDEAKKCRFCLEFIPYRETAYHVNGEKWSEIYFNKDGIPDGLETYWHENGQKRVEGTYRDGKQHGTRTVWYDNGQMSDFETYKDGQFDGTWTQWYYSGEKWREKTYKDDVNEGFCFRWYKNGQKQQQQLWEYGELISETCWDKNGNECECDEKWWEGCI